MFSLKNKKGYNTVGIIVFSLRKCLYLLIKLIGHICMYAHYWGTLAYFLYMYNQSDGSSAELFITIILTFFAFAVGMLIATLGGALIIINENCKPDIQLKESLPNSVVLKYLAFAVLVTPLTFYLRSMTTVLPQDTSIMSDQNEIERPVGKTFTNKKSKVISHSTDKVDWNKVYLLPGNKFSFDKLGIRDSYQQLISAARNGDSDAKVQVAMLYMHGVGVKQDFDKAEYWFKQSANDNHPQGQKMYGYTFYGKQNNEAFKYFRKAAQQGDMEAQYLVSKLYIEGTGVHKSIEKSEYWFDKAIANENVGN
ncbi:tetratricopeptide repeat protein [uncultured Shewanella sp.]|uniref:tetratricopeptide repeat protein n=1 Tax=uncultured Shewanella sp. TaxID=173975 RepID=UPI0026094E57|nr:tetratricopeptide repeat protein [uncultured Shewanella sp.]